jgi:hypothetical protein
MQVDRRCDVDGIDIVIGDQLIPLAVPSSGAEFVGECLRELWPIAADGNEIAVGQVPQRWSDALSCDVSATDQAPSQSFCHPGLAKLNVFVSSTFCTIEWLITNNDK